MVHKNGSKYWQQKYRVDGKERILSFGFYPETSLKEARNKRYEARKQIQDGFDPSQEKKLAKLTRLINTENSFENVAREWHEKQNQKLTAKHSKTVLRQPLKIQIYLGKFGFLEVALMPRTPSLSPHTCCGVHLVTIIIFKNT